MAIFEPMDHLLPSYTTDILKDVTDALRARFFFLPTSKWALSLRQMAAILHQYAKYGGIEGTLHPPLPTHFFLLLFPKILYYAYPLLTIDSGGLMGRSSAILLQISEMQPSGNPLPRAGLSPTATLL